MKEQFKSERLAPLLVSPSNAERFVAEPPPNPSIERTFKSRPRYALVLFSASRGRLLNAAHVKR
jgi:hypothetical protein